MLLWSNECKVVSVPHSHAAPIGIVSLSDSHMLWPRGRIPTVVGNGMIPPGWDLPVPGRRWLLSESGINKLTFIPA